MADSGKPAFNARRWYWPLFVVVMAVCIGLCIWLLNSGAMAAWDRYSPMKSGPQLSLLWSTIIGIPVGLLIGLFLMAELEVFYQGTRRKD